MDVFFTRKTCQRCGKSLKNDRTMSMYNTDCICLDCADQESKRADYKDAVKADHEQIEKGNFNNKGVGYND